MKIRHIAAGIFGLACLLTWAVCYGTVRFIFTGECFDD